MAVRFREDYNGHFDSRQFLQHCFTTPDGAADEGDFLPTQLRRLTEALQTGKYSGERLLDIGCGPTIHLTTLASRYYQQIYLSDYTLTNREEVTRWRDQHPHAHDWTPFFKYAADTEGNHSDWQSMERRFRSALKDILPCDVTQTNPLHPHQVGEFDCIISSLCLECACVDHAAYKEAVRNITRLLKPGGHVMIIGVLNETYYKVGAENFFCLKLDEKLVRETFEQAGYTDIYIHTHQFGGDLLDTIKRSESMSDFESFFFMTATKIIL